MDKWIFNLTNKSSALLFSAFLLLAAQATFADTLTGKVVKVHDGDTIHVLQADNVREKIRLSGIDTPELGQPYGKAARKYLASFIAGKQVIIEWDKKDRYGRIVGKVLLDGSDINLELVKAGYAWHYKKYQREQSKVDQSLYSEVEAIAKDAKKGLFVEPNAVPPWEWRKRKN